MRRQPGTDMNFRRSLPEIRCLSQGLPRGMRSRVRRAPKAVTHPLRWSPPLPEGTLSKRSLALGAGEKNGPLFGTLWPTLHPRFSAPVRRRACVAPAVGDDRGEWNGKDYRSRCTVLAGVFRTGKVEFVDFGTVGSRQRADVRQEIGRASC